MEKKESRQEVNRSCSFIWKKTVKEKEVHDTG